MRKLIDITGKQFSYLIATNEYERRGRKIFQKCKCICGKEVIVEKYRLMSGHTASCGCKTYEMSSKSKRKNIIGQIFGYLSPIGEPIKINNIWKQKCKCVCGKEKYINRNHLLSGRINSCGCIKKHKLCGKKFNKLLVLSEKSIIDETNGGKNCEKLLCLCDCGNKKYINRVYLLSGKTKSCGCDTSDKMGKSLIKNIIGNKFNKLTAISEPTYKIQNNKKIYYTMFRCDCGKEKLIRKTNVVSGEIASCGSCDGKRINGQLVSKQQLLIHKLINVGCLNYKSNKYFLDIALVYKGQKIAIEYDCWYWHKNKIENDIIRDFNLITKNWKILHIKSSEKIPTIQQIYEKLDLLSFDNPIEEIVLSDWGD